MVLVHVVKQEDIHWNVLYLIVPSYLPTYQVSGIRFLPVFGLKGVAIEDSNGFAGLGEDE